MSFRQEIGKEGMELLGVEPSSRNTQRLAGSAEEEAKRRAFVIRQGDVIRMKNEPGLVVAETLDGSDWLTVKEHDQTGNGFWIGFHFRYSFSSVNSLPE